MPKKSKRPSVDAAHLISAQLISKAKRKAERGRQAGVVTTSWSRLLKARPGFKLAKVDPASTPGFDGDKQAGEDALKKLTGDIASLQERLFAESKAGGTRSLLLVIQGMDTSGKGGIMRHVVGALDPSHDAVDALLAGFPAGTVSGAPKVRACQIIAELEKEKRGAYAGGVGYFSPDGSMDSCIVLRTALVKDGVMHVQAGAGIVADSDPAYEQRECEAKAGALAAAAREAVRVAGEAGFGQ